jgi:hypothetical protein
MCSLIRICIWSQLDVLWGLNKGCSASKGCQPADRATTGMCPASHASNPWAASANCTASVLQLPPTLQRHARCGCFSSLSSLLGGAMRTWQLLTLQAGWQMGRQLATGRFLLSARVRRAAAWPRPRWGLLQRLMPERMTCCTAALSKCTQICTAYQ